MFKVSGCTSPIVGKDRCSDWEEQHYTVPVPRQSPSPKPQSAPPPAGALAWSQNTNGGIPQNAIRLGKDSDGEALFGCTAPVGPAGRQTMQPGKLSRKLGGCSVGYGGQEYLMRDYHVFVSSLDYHAFALAPVNGGPLPARSVSGGADTDGKALYFCVVQLSDGSEQVGKIQAGWKACNYAYGGREHSYGGYKVLVLR